MTTTAVLSTVKRILTPSGEDLTSLITTPKFRDPSTMTHEQLTDPDYSMKLIARRAGLDPNKILACSKCHHCR